MRAPPMSLPLAPPGTHWRVQSAMLGDTSYLIVDVRLYTDRGREANIWVRSNGDWYKFQSPRWKDDNLNLPIVCDLANTRCPAWGGIEAYEARKQACVDCMMDDLAEQIAEHHKYGPVKP